MKQKRVLMAAYSKADTDGSGYVGKAEFALMLRYVVYYFRIWLLFREMDTSADSRVNLDEFRLGLVSFELVFHPDDDINECYIQQEWYTLDPDGDGLILFDNFVTFALRWQLVEDFDKQTAAGSGQRGGKLRTRPELDKRFLEGADAEAFRKGATAGDKDPDSWRTDASETFDRITGRTDDDIRALSLAFYERAVAAGTVAPVGDDDPSALLGGGMSRPSSAISSAGSGELFRTESGRVLDHDHDGTSHATDGFGHHMHHTNVSGTNGGSLKGYTQYARLRESGDHQGSVGNESSLFLKHWDSTEPVPSYGEACDRDGLSLQVGDHANWTSKKGVPVLVEVLFVGRVHFASGVLAGIGVLGFQQGFALGGPDAAPQTAQEKANNARMVGKHDGKHEGVRYFRCPDRCGLFVRPASLELIHR